MATAAALYNVEVTGPEHAVLVTNRACCVALGDRGVAHLTVSKDTQMMRLAADKRSMGNPGARTSSSWMPVNNQPPADQLRAAADVLNSGRGGVGGRLALHDGGHRPSWNRAVLLGDEKL